MQLLPDPATRLRRPVPDREDAGAELLHRRPVHRRGLQPRPAQRRHEGRGVPQGAPASPTRVLRPRGRVLHLRRRPLRDQAERRLLLHRLDRGRLEHRPRRGGRQPRLQDRATRAATSRSRRSTTTPTCATQMVAASSIEAGLEVERAHHEVGTAGQAEINYRFDTLLHAGDKLMLFKYIVKNVAWAARQDGDLHAEAALRRQRLRHALPPVAVEGRRAAVLRRARLRRPVRHWPAGTSAACSSTRRRCSRSPTRRSTPTTAWCPASRPRSTWSTRSATARPASASRSPARTRRPSASSSACRTRRATRTSRSRRC